MIEEKGIVFPVSETGKGRLYVEDLKTCLGEHDDTGV